GLSVTGGGHRRLGVSRAAQRDARSRLARCPTASASDEPVEVTNRASAIRRLEWDSSFFGFPIGEAHATTHDELMAAEQDGARERLRCLYLLIRSEHFDLVQAAETIGFRLTGVRMSFLAEAPFRADLTGTGATRVRPAQASDIDALERIATTAHPDTRFFA